MVLPAGDLNIDLSVSKVKKRYPAVLGGVKKLQECVKKMQEFVLYRFVFFVIAVDSWHLYVSMIILSDIPNCYLCF